MKKKYGTIMLLTSLQYANHVREYFIENSRKTIALYILPRKGKKKNFFEFYENGELREKKELISPSSLILSLFFLYCNYLYLLFKYTKRGEKIFFINYLYIFSFLKEIVRIFRNVEFVCWIGDYWPTVNLYLKLHQWFVKQYHSSSKYAFYQTDRINKKINGKILNTFNRKTIIPGITPPKIDFSKKIYETIHLCFVGVLVEWQGIDLLLQVVSKNSNIFLRILGTGDEHLVRKYKNLIKLYKIEKQVYFPNKFFYGKDLEKEVKKSHIGIALYEVDPRKVTHYADPAKIKQYMEYGLPIIMTNAAEVTSYIKRFKAGEIVARNVPSVLAAIKKIRAQYKTYLKNLDQLNHWLDYNKYYQKEFKFLES